MAEFLVELYLPRGNAASAQDEAARAKAAAEQLTKDGRPVLFLRSIFVPEEETCFFLFRADAASVVGEAGRRAGLRFERISEATSLVGNGGQDGTS